MGLHLVAMALAAAAPESAPPPPPDVIVEGVRPDPDQIICEKIVGTGSRVAVKRVCATRREWEQAQRDDRDAVDDSMRRALHQNQPPH